MISICNIIFNLLLCFEIIIIIGIISRAFVNSNLKAICHKLNLNELYWKILFLLIGKVLVAIIELTDLYVSDRAVSSRYIRFALVASFERSFLALSALNPQTLYVRVRFRLFRKKTVRYQRKQKNCVSL